MIIRTCVTYSAVPAFFPAAAAAGKGKEEERMESVAAAAKPLLKDEANSRRVLLEPSLLLLAPIWMAVARRPDADVVMEEGREEEGEKGEEARKPCAGVEARATRRARRPSGAWQLARLAVLVLSLELLLVPLVNMMVCVYVGLRVATQSECDDVCVLPCFGCRCCCCLGVLCPAGLAGDKEK